MVTTGELYLLLVTVMALVALAAALPVLLNIVREGRERWRGGPETGPDAAGERGGAPVDGYRCSNCGATNENGYVYCQRCAERL